MNGPVNETAAARRGHWCGEMTPSGWTYGQAASDGAKMWGGRQLRW